MEEQLERYKGQYIKPDKKVRKDKSKAKGHTILHTGLRPFSRDGSCGPRRGCL